MKVSSGSISESSYTNTFTSSGRVLFAGKVSVPDAALKSVPLVAVPLDVA